MSKPSRSSHDIIAIRRQNTTEASRLEDIKSEAMQPTPSEASTGSTLSGATANTVLGDYPDTPEIYFSSVEQFFQEYERFAKEGHAGFTVHNVTPEKYEQIIQFKGELHALRVKLYLPETMELLITVPRQPHEDLHLLLNDEIYSWYRGTCNWKRTGASEFDSLAGPESGQASKGQGDSGGKPKDARPNDRDWPTVVIEGGYSQTLEQLRRKMRWWFWASKSKVKIVLLASFENPWGRPGPEDKIIVEKWIETLQSGPSINTRSGQVNTEVLRPSLDHVNVIEYNGPLITASNWHHVDLNHFVVIRGDMVLEHRHLFLRPLPNGQANLVLGQEFWRNYALEVLQSVRTFRDKIVVQSSYGP